MKTLCLRVFGRVAAAATAAVMAAAPSSAQGVFTGDVRLACEAILCLASGSRPSECTPSLRRYFSISYRKLNDTIRARANFLRLCPASEQTPEMQSLVSAMADGAGRCDAQSLNLALFAWSGLDDSRTYIGNRMPGYCLVYTGHAYTSTGDLAPRYVGAAECIGETTGGRIAAAIKGGTGGAPGGPLADAAAGSDVGGGHTKSSRPGMGSKLREAADRVDQAGGADAPLAAFEKDRLQTHSNGTAGTPVADEAAAFVNRGPGAAS